MLVNGQEGAIVLWQGDRVCDIIEFSDGKYL